jgi:molybdenum-dependent DNA-binding transcriptional regulator ModE
MPSDTILEIRKDGERFLKALSQELYRNLAGLKKQGDLKAIYKSHPTFGDPDVFFSVKRMSPKDEEEEKGLKLILSFLARSVIESKTAKLRDEILTIEATDEITVDRKAIPYRSAWAEIKRKLERVRREEIDKKRIEMVLRLEPLFLKIFEITHNAASELGFSYTSLCDEIEVLNLSEIEEKARLFLKDTEYVYRDLLRWFLLKRMELKLKDAKWHDLCYLFNSFELRAGFPKRDLKAIARRLLDEMGIETRDNIKTDLEERRGKISHSLCIPIEVPQNIMPSIYPVGGVEDYESFLHELGIALLYEYRNLEDKFEFRRLTEFTSAEVFGFLFRNLLLQPKWLRRYLKLDASDDSLRLLHLKQLMMIRHCSGKLVYEIFLHKDENFKSKSDLYRQTLKEATFSEHNGADYLNDVDPFFHSASYLRGYIIEAELKLYLRENFDEEWWREKEAGGFIRKMWEEGGRITSEVISKRAGFEQLGLAPLLGFFREVF